MIIIRWRWRQLGGHVHVRVFTGTMFDGTFAKCGDLTFSEDEWRILGNGIRSAREDVVVQVKHEDEL